MDNSHILLNLHTIFAYLCANYPGYTVQRTVSTVAYRLYTVVPRLVKFVDQLTNWYVRMNRRRLKGEGGITDCKQALQALFSVLYSMTKVMVSV